MEKFELGDTDARIISIIVKNEPTLFDIKNHLLSLQKSMIVVQKLTLSFLIMKEFELIKQLVLNYSIVLILKKVME